MKILISQKRFHPNSIEIVNAFLEKGHQVKMFVQGSDSADENHSKLKPVIIPYNRFFHFLFNNFMKKNSVVKYCPPKISTLVLQLKSYKPDIIILKKFKATNLYVYIIARLMGCKQIVLLSDSSYGNESNFFLKGLKKLNLFPRKSIYTEKKQVKKDENIKKGSEKNIFLPYPVSINEPVFKKEKGKIRLLFVGKYTSKRKRPGWILEAIKEKKLISKTTLTCVGLGMPTNPSVIELKKQAESFNYENSLNLEFNVPYEKMKDFYESHDVFVLPAKDEPFGMVVLEALANGLPILCSDTCGSRHAVIDDYNGYIFETENFDDFSDKLSVLCSDRKVIEEFGNRSKQIAIENYSGDSWVEKFFSFLES